jgi:FkbM family methyltransferase
MLLKNIAKSVLKSVGLYEPARASYLWFKRPEWWKRKRERIRFYAGLAPKGSLCFDIGANVGEYTADLLAVGVGRVVALEPLAACVSQLRERYANNSQVILIPAAVGSSEGHVTLHASDAIAIASCSTDWLEAVKASGRFEGHDWSKSVEVPMTTLDRLIADHGRPAFCKIDVEGFELDVLRGLSQSIPAISFEFSPEKIDKTCECVARLAEIDARYRFNYCSHGFLSFGLPQRLAAPEFQAAMRNLPAQPMKHGGDVYAWCAEGTR